MDDLSNVGAIKLHTNAITKRSVPRGEQNELMMVALTFWVQAVNSSTSLNRERSGAPIGCTPSIL